MLLLYVLIYVQLYFVCFVILMLGGTVGFSVFSPPSTMRRDYYRGSQDCLAETRRTSASVCSGKCLDLCDDTTSTHQTTFSGTSKILQK